MGRYDRLYPTDLLFVAHTVWVVVALNHNNPDQAVQNAGIYAIEFLGGYVLARAYIRGPDQFSALVRAVLFLVLATLPLALHESQTGRPWLVEMIRRLPGVTSVAIVTIEERLGLERVQAVFAQPDPLRAVHLLGLLAHLRRAARGDGRRAAHRLGRAGGVLVLLVAVLGRVPGAPDAALRDRLGGGDGGRQGALAGPGGALRAGLRGDRPAVQPHARARVLLLRHLLGAQRLLARHHLRVGHEERARRRRGRRPGQPALRHRAQRLGAPAFHALRVDGQLLARAGGALRPAGLLHHGLGLRPRACGASGGATSTPTRGFGATGARGCSPSWGSPSRWPRSTSGRRSSPTPSSSSARACGCWRPSPTRKVGPSPRRPPSRPAATRASRAAAPPPRAPRPAPLYTPWTPREARAATGGPALRRAPPRGG